MDKLRSLIRRQSSYEAVPSDHDHSETDSQNDRIRRFPWTEYSVFFLLGVAMLWAWYNESLFQ